MSAFLVEEQTINRLVARAMRDFDADPWLAIRVKELGLNFKSSKELAIDMYGLNCESLRQRYNDRDFPSFKYVPEVPPAHLYALKNLECFLYQCMEGTVPDKPLYKFLDEVYKVYLMKRVIEDLPLYQKIQWR